MSLDKKVKEKKGFSFITEGRMKDSSVVEYGETSKFAREDKRKNCSAKEDRLSNLPDEIIHRVLSFADALSAVQTSVLSKRWKHLWTSLPVLNFDSSSLPDSLLFPSFVDHFFACRDASSNVRVLNLACHDDLHDGHLVDSVIDHVTLTPSISAAIQALSILAECVVAKLPQLSVCQSLTSLKLADISAEIAATMFDFASLEQLYLLDCHFECGSGELLDLFRGCINLRCLFLHDCQFYGKIKRFEIFAPSLTHLSLSRMRIDEVFDSDCVVELFTPKLQSFSYRDSDLYDFSIKLDLSLVEKVDIVVDCLTLTMDPDFSLRLIEFFEVMGSAKFVSLSPDIIEVLSMFPDLLIDRSSPFTRMQTFELNMDRPSSSYVIPTNVMDYLFGGSPGFDFFGWEEKFSMLKLFKIQEVGRSNIDMWRIIVKIRSCTSALLRENRGVSVRNQLLRAPNVNQSNWANPGWSAGLTLAMPADMENATDLAIPPTVRCNEPIQLNYQNELASQLPIDQVFSR
ncbi:F-box protein, partial [Mucuna pruriens]